MKAQNLKQFAATKLRGNFDQVQSTFREFESTKEEVRKKSVTAPGNASGLPLELLAQRANVHPLLIYSATVAHIRFNTIIVILHDGSQLNVPRYV